MNGFILYTHSYKQCQKLLFAHYSKFNYNTVSVSVFLRIITISIYGFTLLDSKYIHNHLYIHSQPQYHSISTFQLYTQLNFCNF